MSFSLTLHDNDGDAERDITVSTEEGEGVCLELGGLAVILDPREVQVLSKGLVVAQEDFEVGYDYEIEDDWGL